jgi:hypothetical protein
MPTRNRISRWFIPLLILLLILTVAGCSDEEATPTPPPVAPAQDTSAQDTPIAAVAEESEVVAPESEQPSAVNQAPVDLQIKSAPSPAIDPVCLVGGEGFQLLSAPLPDNGLEPERKYNEKHVRYSDISEILDQISHNSVISVFQHFRRKKFKDDFARIKERLLAIVPTAHLTGIYWHQLMFVIIGLSIRTMENIRQINKAYAEVYSVEII